MNIKEADLEKLALDFGLPTDEVTLPFLSMHAMAQDGEIVRVLSAFKRDYVTDYAAYRAVLGESKKTFRMRLNVALVELLHLGLFETGENDAVIEEFDKQFAAHIERGLKVFAEEYLKEIPTEGNA